MGKFGWDLPPGCTTADIEAQVGDDLPAEVEDILAVMEDHLVPTKVCDRIVEILMEDYPWSNS